MNLNAIPSSRAALMFALATLAGVPAALAQPQAQPQPQATPSPSPRAVPAVPAVPLVPGAPAAPLAPVPPPVAPVAPLPPLPPLPPPTSGTAESRLYAPGAFDAVEISGGAATVRFTQGATDQIVVRGDDERQKAGSLEVRGDTLRIRPAGAWKFWGNQRMEIQVTARHLTRVSISGAADWYAPAAVETERLTVSISGAGMARFDRLKAERLNFQVSGAGDGQMAGAVKELNLTISGRSEFRGEELMTERTRVSISGIGDVKVWALENLDISVAGIGSVDYWGSPPRLRRSVSGQASINDRGAKKAPAP